MRTVGEILKNTRLEKKLTLEEIEAATRIRGKYLEAIEKNEFTKIPGGAAIVKGFIRNFAQVLGLSPAEVLTVLRRDFRESKTGQIIPHGYYEPLNQPRLAWSPRLTLIAGIAVLILATAFYLSYQVSSYLGAPHLTVSGPLEGAVVREEEIEVLGKSDADATVLVNGELVVLDKKGNFKARISLSQGENIVKVEAVSRRGKKTEIMRKVERESW